MSVIICQFQLFLAGVPGQSGLAAATHAVGETDSDSGAANWMATSAREIAQIMRSATLRRDCLPGLHCTGPVKEEEPCNVNITCGTHKSKTITVLKSPTSFFGCQN